MFKSTVYLVGAGPGDSGLITVRGLELIRKADCIIYDYLVNSELLKFRKNNCKLIYAGKKAGAHTLTQDEINQLLVREAKVYRNVVRLKGGDPFIFGRGAEEALYLRKKKINFDVVPGISSAIAVPAYAGIPLTERSKNSTVGFITGHEDPAKIDSGIDWGSLAKALGTMVFLMGVGNLGLIAKRLIGCGKPKDTPVALIRWGTTAKQKTVTGTLSNIAGLARKNKITPPAVIVIGETVELRKELNWFEKKPLFAKRIIVTRTREQAGLLSEKLMELGAEVIEIPTIEVVSLKADKLLKNAFLFDEYDWIFFTSQNGVSEFSAFLERAGKDSRIFGKARICAIGSETAKSLHKIGIKPDYLPPRFVAEEVIKHFKKMQLKRTVAKYQFRHSEGVQWTTEESHPRRDSSPSPSVQGQNDAQLRVSSALILRAKKARDILPEGLKEAGFEVKIIDLYDTALPKESVKLIHKILRRPAIGRTPQDDPKVHWVTFTSSSTVENFVKLLGSDYRHKLSGVKFASIGPVTSSALKKFGLKADVEAKVYTIEGLVKAMTN